MAPEHKLIIKGADGVKRAEVVDYTALSYTKRVNSPGLLTFQLLGEHSAIAELEEDGIVEAWRRDADAGLAWHCDFRGLYRGSVQAHTERGVAQFRGYVQGALSLLARRIVAWPAGVDGRSKFTNTPAETVLKNLVAYNATSVATTGNGRHRAGAITGLSVATDQGRGNVISWACAYKPLLEQLQGIARVAGGDFDLVYSAPASWTFEFYPPQLGVDRSATTHFAMLYGNMASPTLTRTRLDERTVAIVAGQGDDVSREIAIVTGPDYALTRDIEAFVDARNVELGDTAALTARGNEALDAARVRTLLSYRPLATRGTIYGRDFALGDLVTAQYLDVTVVQQVYAVTVTLGADGGEDVTIEMREV